MGVVSTTTNMGVNWVTVGVVTAFWAVVGAVLPFILGRGPNKGVIQVVLVTSAVTCWLFWVLSYMHQMNPLLGPQLHSTTLLAIQYLWDGTIDIDDLPTVAPETTTEMFTGSTDMLTDSTDMLTGAF